MADEINVLERALKMTPVSLSKQTIRYSVVVALSEKLRSSI